MSDYANAWDALTKAIGRAKDNSFGYFQESEHLSTDQQIETAKVAAILSVAQEISKLNDDMQFFLRKTTK